MKKKNWMHDRFLKKKKELREKREAKKSRQILKDMCRIVGHNYVMSDGKKAAAAAGYIVWYFPTDYQCTRCGNVPKLEWTLPESQYTTVSLGSSSASAGTYTIGSGSSSVTYHSTVTYRLV